MTQKIKKYLHEDGEYNVFETEEGQKGLAHKKHNLKVGDTVKAIKIEDVTEAEDMKNKIEKFAEDIAWLFSKV